MHSIHYFAHLLVFSRSGHIHDKVAGPADGEHNHDAKQVVEGSLAQAVALEGLARGGAKHLRNKQGQQGQLT